MKLLALTFLGLAACGGKSSSPATAEQCDAAGTGAGALAGKQATKSKGKPITDADRKTVSDIVGPSVAKRCKDDAWTAEAADCVAHLDPSEVEKCKQALTDDQKARLQQTQQRLSIEIARQLGKADKQQPLSLDPKPEPTQEPTPAPAKTTKGGKQTYALAEGSGKLSVTLDGPDGFTDKSNDDQVLLFTPSGTKLAINVTCDGTCGEDALLVKNIKATAQDKFDFTKTAMSPALAPVWDMEPKEVSPKTWRWELHGDAPKDPGFGMRYVTVERLLDDKHILACSVEVPKKDADKAAALAKACEQLTYAKP